MPPSINPKRTLILGAAWTVGTRWSIKGIGFLNTVIMARLLMPADYGIVAMSMLVVGLIQALMDFGATTALLRKGEVTRDEIDSAWTLRWLQSLAVGLILLIAAPLAANYFNEIRVQYVLWTLAACVAFAGAGNIGVVLAQKAFNFSLDFKIQVTGKILGVIATVAAGYLLRDYRALVTGIAISYISGMLLSYMLHPYRPRWNTSRFGDIWAITKWLMLAGVGGFILRKGDELIAARVGTTGDYGLYNVGADLGQMPTGEVGPAMLRAFLPVLASMQGSVEKINSAVIKTATAVNTITFPIGFGFAALSTPACRLILGPNWNHAAPYVALFALVSTLQIVQNPFTTLLTMRGHTKVQSKVIWLEFAVFLVSAAALVPHFYLLGLIYARMLGSTVNMITTFLAVRNYCALSLRTAAVALLRPLLGAIFMYFLVQTVNHQIDSDGLKIAIGITYGFFSFSLWSVGTWLVAGKPAGLESTLFAYIQTKKNSL